MSEWTKPLRLTLSGLLLLSLMPWLTSCVTVAMPPQKYLRETPITQPAKGKLTNGDVAKLAQDRAWDTEAANADKAAIRAWYEGYCAARGFLCRVRKD